MSASTEGWKGGELWPKNLPMLVLERCGTCKGEGVVDCHGETRLVQVACPACEGEGTVFVEVGGHDAP